MSVSACLHASGTQRHQIRLASTERSVRNPASHNSALWHLFHENSGGASQRTAKPVQSCILRLVTIPTVYNSKHCALHKEACKYPRRAVSTLLTYPTRLGQSYTTHQADGQSTTCRPARTHRPGSSSSSSGEGSPNAPRFMLLNPAAAMLWKPIVAPPAPCSAWRRRKPRTAACTYSAA